MSGPLNISLERGGELLLLTLARPKANVVDVEMIAALNAAVVEHRGRKNLKAILLDAEGPNFSFGASVEEHLPDQCAAMLKSLHGLLINMMEAYVPILVAIRGQCLGGGLEVALAGNFLFCAPDAKLGQPEIKLGVIAPAATSILPHLIGRAAAEDMLITGRSLSAEEAKAIGLVHEIADDPRAAALSYFDKHLAQKSASSLRLAVRAARFDLVQTIKKTLNEIERLYLDDVMATRDAVEGLTAFLEKRAPKWENC
jgi:cyclohexa-1,5-dienecarbonyl-CoA hydratase